MSADASIDTPLNTDNPWADAVTASDSPAPSSAPDTAAGSGDPWADSSAAPERKSANPPTAAPRPCTVPMNPRIGITHIIVRARV